MTGEFATRWVRTVVPSWLYRWLLPVGWGAAVAVSIFTGEDIPCSVEDPAYCGPDPVFSAAFVACLASLLLLWWQPVVALTAGVVFMVLELRYDDFVEARIAWTVYGAACVALLCWMLAAGREQRSLVMRSQRRQVQVPAASAVGLTLRLGVAGALMLAGIAALLLMNWQDGREEAHLQRAVEQTAVVKAQGEEGEIILELPNGRTHTVTMFDDHETGAQIPVFVDLADAEWIRPVAEPADYTYWITAAGSAWLLAALLVLRDLKVRRARPRRSWLAQGLPVRVEPDTSEAFAVYSADGDVLLGFIELTPDDENAELELLKAFDALGEDEEEVPRRYRQELSAKLQKYRGDALLVGELAERAWPTILIGGHVFRPERSFRAPRQVLWWRELADGFDGPLSAQNLPPEPEIDPATELPVLPWEAPLEPRFWWSKPALIALVAGLPVAAAAFALWGDWFVAVCVLVLGTVLIHIAAFPVFFRVTATATHLWVRAGWFEQVVPWRAVVAIDLDEDRLNIETDNDWHVLKGIATGQVEQVTAIFEALRLRSATAAVEKERMRPAPALWLELGFLVVGTLILVGVGLA
ncbi:hypothetical protein HPO96_18940 [Kribbella sandramycini]|uniref:Uncharacterized protein n=1 Tax=Kribbella sandramycini TaxID=60450 RepID=A0A7Y4L0Z1_9ACTN|nr:hypothetical protein [Kribbella sandramycini]MBB6564624.1 hypothetical protein [Kribbella sandramycini]NOL42328.1 hypothetical protein [Kribbella sandramycini]